MDFDALLADLNAGCDRLARRRRRRASIILFLACVLIVAGAATAGVIIGSPAPQHVKNEIAAVDQGLPADLRLNPDAQNAQAVASTESSTLYAASLQDGGYCTEIVTRGDRGRGATCVTPSQLLGLPIELTLPSDDTSTSTSPVTMGGRVNVAAVSLEIRYGDGGTDRISLDNSRYFVFDVPVEHLAAAHEDDILFVALSAGGDEVARSRVPADWDGPVVADTTAPLFVSTRSDSSDLTKVYGIEGRVGVSNAASLELRYQDGTTANIALSSGQAFSYTVPAHRVGDFMSPQKLIARDKNGRMVANAYVAAVAYWRGKERGR